MIEHSREYHRPLGQLFSDLTMGISRLFRDEVDLAKTELSQKMSQALRDVLFLVIGGLVGYSAFLLLLAAIVLGLAEFLPLWLSALLIGLAVSSVAYSLIGKGINDLKRRNVRPEKTLETLKEGVKWAKEQI